MTAAPLIAPVELARRMRDPQWIVVDCRFTLTDPAAGRAAYVRSHIPRARYAHLDHDLARKPGPGDGRHPLPDPQTFADRLGRWGITNDSVVIAYDEGGGAIAARLWWMLRWVGHSASLVLDGGFAAWQAAKLPVESGERAVAAARFVPSSIDADAAVSATDITALQAQGRLVVDARAAARYRGEQEPIDRVAGHVPGAVNRPFSANLLPDGRFRAPEELRRELLELFGNRPPADIVAMCGSGVTACHLLLAMEIAGLQGGRLFAGSWSEWIADPARPVHTGPEP